MEQINVTFAVRKQLAGALRGGQAFDKPKAIFEQVLYEHRFSPLNPDGRSPWQIIDHMRLSLEDLIAYIDNEDDSYVVMNWPSDYWSENPEDGGTEEWEEVIEGFFHALNRMEELVLDESRELLKPFAWSDGHTLMREALLAIEHTAYHCGQRVELSEAVDQ